MITKIKYNYNGKIWEEVEKTIREKNGKENYLLGMEILEERIISGHQIVKEDEQFIRIIPVDKEEGNNFWIYIVLNKKRDIEEVYKSKKGIDYLEEFNELKRNGLQKVIIKNREVLNNLLKKGYVSYFSQNRDETQELNQSIIWSVNKYFIYPIDYLSIIEIEEIIKDNFKIK